MNNLKNMRTYLAGAMDRVPDGGVVWRDKITPLLESKGVVVLNPCDKPVEVGIEDASTRASIEELKEKLERQINNRKKEEIRKREHMKGNRKIFLSLKRRNIE